MGTYLERKLAQHHKFTRLELHNILKDALENEPESYWGKPNFVNKGFTNGYFFNCCVKWLKYEKGINDDTFPEEIIVVRVLQGFKKYSKIKLPQKQKTVASYLHHENPSL